MAPHSSTLAWKSHGRRSLVGCSQWGRKESDTTEQLHFHFSLSCIGEGNGNPLQCSCLQNPRDGGAWWASIYGVAQSQKQLKRLSISVRWSHRSEVSWHLLVGPCVPSSWLFLLPRRVFPGWPRSEETQVAGASRSGVWEKGSPWRSAWGAEWLAPAASSFSTAFPAAPQWA